MNRGARVVVLVLVAVVALVSLPATWARSANPCSECHSSTRYQYLDLLEGNQGNLIPASMSVGETRTVTVVVQNLCNSPQYAVMSGVSVTLASQNGHFTVSNPTYSVGSLPVGTRTATWQITGVSPGPDAYVITAQGRNTHNSVSFRDTYSPTPPVSVAAAPQGNPTVTVNVRDSSTSLSLPGAVVSLGAIQQTTNANGAATFTVPAGTYALAISKTGYTATSESLVVSASAAVNRSLAPIVAPQTYAVSVTVSDSSNSSKLQGADVTLGGVQRVTGVDGAASFSVPAGTYPLRISKTGYAPVGENLTVAASTAVARSLTPLLVEKRYAVRITVVDSSSSAGLPGANVTLGVELVVTGADGVAAFSVPPGDYDLEILKDGYDPIFEQLQVSGDASLIRVLATSPPPPATDLNPLMVFIHPPIAIASYVLVFAFAAYLLMRTTRTKTLFRLGFSAWLFTLLALVSGMIWAQSAWGSYWSWEPKEATALALFVLISAAVIALDEGRMDVTRLLALASCAPILLALPYYFALVGIALMLIVYAARLDRDPEAKRSPAAVHRRAAAIKLNRVVSWLFVAFAVASLASGYVLTRLGVDPALTTLIHTYLGYVFAALLSIHVALSLMAGYPWVMILRNFRDRRSSLSVAMLIQEATAAALLILSAGQVLTGLGWANPYIAALIPLRVHVDLDAALLLVIIIHGAAGVKFASMRRRISLPGGDLLLVAVTVLLTAMVYYLGL